MDRGLYTAATGMSIADLWISTISNNLANASTTGFKKDTLVFNEAFERSLNGSSGEIGEIGAGPAPYGSYSVWENGALSTTGNPLDIAVTNKTGAFKVRTEKGEFYSRNGAMALSPTGTLVTSTGAEVLDRNGSAITIPKGRVVISPQGHLSVNDVDIAQIGLYEGDFTKVGDGLFSATTVKEIDPKEVNIQQGFIEQSNVNVVEEMIAMIKLNRAFELAQKSAQSEDESTQRLITILQGR
ncbi:MAG: flagellar hook-basal body protein [Fimbriimonadaceae bacterium]